MIQLSNLKTWAKFVLLYTLGVILWGAYVRATGSGAGCGEHWPLCNGVVLPREAQIQTLIEFTHRLTSGLTLVFIAILTRWVFKAHAPGHLARKAAGYSLLFVLTEAAIGAGLVKFRLVADDQSTYRVVSLSLHLVNTFLLLAALALTTSWIGKQNLVIHPLRGAQRTLARIAIFGCLAVGMLGAVAALGDTLFPSASVAEGLSQDMNPESHYLLRLRAFHPFLAVLMGVYWIGYAQMARLSFPALGSRLANQLSLAVIAQIGFGLLNLLLLAPVWLQLVHLLMADLIWILLVLLIYALRQNQESFLSPVTGDVSVPANHGTLHSR